MKKGISEGKPHSSKSDLNLDWIVGVGGGILVAWFLTPNEFSPIRVPIGVGIGWFLVISWRCIKHKKSFQDSSAPRLGWLGQIIYLGFTVLGLYFLELAVNHWRLHPDQWLEGMAGIVFVIVGLAICFSSWRSDRELAQNSPGKIQESLILGIAGLGFAGVSCILVFLGSPVVGILGTLAFGWGGIIFLKRYKAEKLSDKTK